MELGRRFVLLISASFVLTVLLFVPGAVALQYSNYTSDKYQIQFQHPSDWEVGSFKDGSDIKIGNPVLGNGLLLIQYGNNLTGSFLSTDFTTALYRSFNDSIADDERYKYRSIEEPTFTTIDGLKAGTFLYTFKHKYREDSHPWTSQVWVVFVGNHGYDISFAERSDLFNSPTSVQIRDKFIKSINFLGQSNSSSSNMTGLAKFAK